MTILDASEGEQLPMSQAEVISIMEPQQQTGMDAARNDGRVGDAPSAARVIYYIEWLGAIQNVNLYW